MVFTTFVNGTTADADEVNVNFNNSKAFLGEVRMFALSMTGAITKASLQTAGWAICDGTTPATQGISSPTIETTPNLEHTFIRMSDDDSSGGTGGADTVTLATSEIPAHTHTVSNVHNFAGSSAYAAGGSGSGSGTFTTDSTGGGGAHANIPPYYEVAYFMKVKIV